MCYSLSFIEEIYYSYAWKREIDSARKQSSNSDVVLFQEVEF